MTHLRPLILLVLLVPGCQGGMKPSEAEERETPVTRHTEGRSGQDLDPEVSPDGESLFYASTSFSGSSDLFVKKVGSNTTVRLTSLSGSERFPKVNPVRPRTLAFCSNTTGEWQLYVMPDYERHPDRVVVVSRKGSQNLHPSWSPDGKYIVYCSTDDLSAGQWILKIVDLAERKVRILEGIDGLLPEWSPRGNRIVFQRMRHRDNWYGSIWTLEFSGDRVRNLTAVFSSDDWAAINPSWSPDGKHIVFATVAKSPARRQVLHQADDLWMVGHDGNRPMRITTHPGSDWMPVWTSKGALFFVSDRAGSNRIWSLSLPGNGFPLEPGVPDPRHIAHPNATGP